ncbi:MAG: MlaD family protein, partial [Marinobacterium sp.]|nr:MlaD family protein [Marinobacterium sp.]
RGSLAKDGETYRLYSSETAISEQQFRFYTEYLLLFEQSIRGLKPGAPVEFRGIRIGTVAGLSERHMAYMDDYTGRIPVLIRLEPGRINRFDTVQTEQELKRWIREGMRASLKQGNLLTGALYVDMDIYPDAPRARLIDVDGVQVIPTVSGGLQRIEQQVVAILDKLQTLPVEPVLNSADQALKSADRVLQDSSTTLRQLDTTLQRIDRLIASEAVQDLPPGLGNTLAEIRQTARGFSADSPLYHELNGAIRSLRDVLSKLEPVLETLNERPNALIFDQQEQPDLQPGSSK